jgi:hypothetical protein
MIGKAIDYVSQTFTKAKHILIEAATKMGIDVNALTADDEAAWELKQNKETEYINESPLIRLCKQYKQKTKAVLKDNDLFDKKIKEILRFNEMGIHTNRESIHIAKGIKDSLEIINWYCHFICTKFMRALSGKLEYDEAGLEDKEEDTFQKDSDGSAKVAMIGVNQSIGAWIKLNEIVAMPEETYIDIVLLLTQINTIAASTFPNAKNFKRPGFDGDVQAAEPPLQKKVQSQKMVDTADGFE